MSKTSPMVAKCLLFEKHRGAENLSVQPSSFSKKTFNVWSGFGKWIRLRTFQQENVKELKLTAWHLKHHFLKLEVILFEYSLQNSCFMNWFNLSNFVTTFYFWFLAELFFSFIIFKKVITSENYERKKCSCYYIT